MVFGAAFGTGLGGYGFFVSLTQFSGHNSCGYRNDAVTDNHNDGRYRLSQAGLRRNVAIAYGRQRHDCPIDTARDAGEATPGIFYDKGTERGRPFAYHVFGTAITEVTLDCLRGTYTVDRVHVTHDAGRSLNPLIDLGQLEGGLVQGIGWMTMEEVLHENGRLATDTLIKVADITIPGITTAEIDDFVHQDTLKKGCFPAPLGYKGFPKSVCTSINEVVCHGIPGPRALKNGDIIRVTIEKV